MESGSADGAGVGVVSRRYDLRLQFHSNNNTRHFLRGVGGWLVGYDSELH